ncbi:hypothetical protein Q2941_01895 [Bradyrhizobium sp. UFLA05-153]
MTAVKILVACLEIATAGDGGSHDRIRTAAQSCGSSSMSEQIGSDPPVPTLRRSTSQVVAALHLGTPPFTAVMGL